jgi:hypothetical protein
LLHEIAQPEIVKEYRCRQPLCGSRLNNARNKQLRLVKSERAICACDTDLTISDRAIAWWWFVFANLPQPVLIPTQLNLASDYFASRIELGLVFLILLSFLCLHCAITASIFRSCFG